jgi:thioredoxin-like negative regulator of GroEL
LDIYAASQRRWNFAVLDIDTDNELTSLLQISKTPTVLLVNDGDVVDGMKGLASDKEIGEFFGSLEKILQLKESELLI